MRCAKEHGPRGTYVAKDGHTKNNKNRNPGAKRKAKGPLTQSGFVPGEKKNNIGRNAEFDRGCDGNDKETWLGRRSEILGTITRNPDWLSVSNAIRDGIAGTILLCRSGLIFVPHRLNCCPTFHTSEPLGSFSLILGIVGFFFSPLCLSPSLSFFCTPRRHQAPPPLTPCFSRWKVGRMFSIRSRVGEVCGR